MSIVKEAFGTVHEDEPVALYTITNGQGASISISTLGAGLVRVLMPGKDGALGDCILGYDSPQPYLNPDHGYQGLIVGRCANRIAEGRFTLDSIEYNLPKNHNNCLCLHGAGRLSFNVWTVEETGDHYITLSFFSPDMQDGFPGDFTALVRYTLTQDNTVRIEYTATTDRKTICNMTNHAYFNLACDASTVDDHALMINADYYTETDENIIPTGHLKPLAGTPMDFTELRRIGDGIDAAYQDIIDVRGYDHCFCLRNKKGEFSQCAVLEHSGSGRRLEVYTDMPAVQVYTANWMVDSVGKYGLPTGYRRGICLETQMYPNSPNQPKFPSVVIDEENPFESVTEFRFSVIK